MRTYSQPLEDRRRFNRQQNHFEDAHVRYLEKVAIHLAVEILAGRPHYFTPLGHNWNDATNPCSQAARHLGAVGRTRRELLEDMVGLLRLHDVAPIPSITRAIEHGPY